MERVTVIGAGLAGCEATWQLIKRNIPVRLVEMRPKKESPAFHTDRFAELVCSNSLRSNAMNNAVGILKEELRQMDSLIMKSADMHAVPAGSALAVDRETFSQYITDTIKNHPLVEVVNEEMTSLPEGPCIIATGPLTSDSLAKAIHDFTSEDTFHFYDAAAPIIEKDSINMDIAFWGERYEQEREKDEPIEEWQKRIQSQTEASYLNLPMNKEEYEEFWTALVNAEVVTLHEFEKKEIFEGCMPIEIMAKRGIDTLRFGPLKPVGFTDKRTGYRPYALVQLRQDNTEGNLFNMVGFQTNLKFGEQQRVFSMIPGLENANFVKYGVMHRNTYINSTKLLKPTYQLKNDENIYFAGQITGVEGYVESISSGLVAALNAIEQYNKTNKKVIFSDLTMIGALSKYISTANDNFQPMNANFGILPELPNKIKDKKLKYSKLADRAIEELKKQFNNE